MKISGFLCNGINILSQVFKAENCWDVLLERMLSFFEKDFLLVLGIVLTISFEILD